MTPGSAFSPDPGSVPRTLWVPPFPSATTKEGTTMHARSPHALIAATVLTACLGTVPLAASPAWAAPAGATAGAAALRTGPLLSDVSTVLDPATGAFRLSWTQNPAVRRVSVYASTRPQDPRADGRPVATTAGTGTTGSVSVTGLDPTKRWYFELVPDHAALGTETAVRDIAVPGALNVRDLGGYTTRDGTQVRWGTVFRSASLGTVTPAGDTVLAGLGLREVIDFRTPTETAASGVDVLPPGVTDVNLPIDTGDAGGSLGSLTPAQFAALFGNGQAAADLHQVYQQFVTSPADRLQFGTALKTIAAGGSSPLLFHCSAGKDRTGWMSAVLLTALGVPKNQVYADYLLSDPELAASNAALEAELTDAGYDAALIVPLLTVDRSDLDTAFAEVTQQYGSMDGYLTRGLDLSGSTIAELRARLLQPQALTRS
jgi:protein-tyrosine phosphatase